MKLDITILSGPHSSSDKAWGSFTDDDFPEVMNPRVIHAPKNGPTGSPKDGKYYVCNVDTKARN